MSRGLQTALPALIGFPRVSGDEPLIGQVGMFLNPFSPRERG